MYASACRSRAIPRDTGRGLLWVSLLFAASILAAAWLRSAGPLPGIDLALMVMANLAGGWALNRRARVRGLPAVAGVLMSMVAVGDATLGDSLHGASGGAMFIALLLSTVAPSWGSGLVSMAILTAGVFLSWLT